MDETRKEMAVEVYDLTLLIALNPSGGGCRWRRARRRRRADETRQQNETRFDPHGIRDRLLARRAGLKATLAVEMTR